MSMSLICNTHTPFCCTYYGVVEIKSIDEANNEDL